MKQFAITPRFVELIPTHLESGVLYISEKYGTAIHMCCCGCGQEVVTPLSSAQWQLRQTGGKVTLSPSIGNWNFHCQSHYWIKQNLIEWSDSMTDRQIRIIQERDRHDLQKLTHESNARKLGKAVSPPQLSLKAEKAASSSLWHRLLNWFFDR